MRPATVAFWLAFLALFGCSENSVASPTCSTYLAPINWHNCFGTTTYASGQKHAPVPKSQRVTSAGKGMGGVVIGLIVGIIILFALAIRRIRSPAKKALTLDTPLPATSERVHEAYYLKARRELDRGKANEALWAEAVALNRGLREGADLHYIALRAEQLHGNKTLRASHHSPGNASLDRESSRKQEEDGMFSGFRDIRRKTKAAAIVQNLLKPLVAGGLLEVDTGNFSIELVNKAWEGKPDIFRGKFGQKPHRMAAAAVALSEGIRANATDPGISGALTLALGNLLTEYKANGTLYPLNSLDHTLLQEAGALVIDRINQLHDP